MSYELLFSYLLTNACRICIGDLTFVYCIIEKKSWRAFQLVQVVDYDYYGSARFSRREIASPKTVLSLLMVQNDLHKHV